MSQTTPSGATPMNSTMPSLMDDLDRVAAPAKSSAPREPLGTRLRARLTDWWDGRMSSPGKKKTTYAGGAVLLLAVVGGAYLALRPVPMPDYDTDPIDEVFNFTLLTDEFNALPVEKRVELIGKIVGRIKTMGAGDSAMLAAFAAGIMGQAREQLQANATRLVIDLWDKSALEYAKVPPDKQGEYVDKLVVDLIKTTELIGGQARDVDDATRLADAKKQAQRDVAMLSDPKKAPSGTEFARMWVFMDRTVGSQASGGERARGQQLMRDMTRRLRGQDVHTGKPEGGG